jgi:DNA-binding MarR family transcriptional regulator
VLSETPEITTTELATRLDASRTTVINYLKELRKEGIVSYKPVGPAKLWYVSSSENAERARELSQTKERGRLLSKEIESFISASLKLSLLDNDDIKKLKEAEKVIKKEIGRQ